MYINFYTIKKFDCPMFYQRSDSSVLFVIYFLSFAFLFLRRKNRLVIFKI